MSVISNGGNTVNLEDGPDHRLITEAKARNIWDRIRGFQREDGQLMASVSAWWRGELRWARNRVTLASDRREMYVLVIRKNSSGEGRVITNQVDDASLEAAVRAAERKLEYGMGTQLGDYDGIDWMPPRLPFPDTSIWSDATFNITPTQRGELAHLLSERAETNHLLSAGFVEMRVGEQCSFGTPDDNDARIDVRQDDNINGSGAERTARAGIYLRHTESQCSMTVRHPKGVGSGWAGLSGYDWSVFDAKRLAEQAFQKCQTSLNPVAIEPGRYTVILEPQAVAGLVGVMMSSLENRILNEKYVGPFTLGDDPDLKIRRTKLGLKIVDERITISHQPMDKQLGVLPQLGLAPVTWIEHGVLKTLGYNRGMSLENYSLDMLNENLPMLGRGSYQVSGGNTNIDEMIATTKRGVLVSRFFGIELIDQVSLLSTGVTRDGLWLIENGKISKAIKNMRWTDSPLFMLNQVEQLGTPVPIFQPVGFGLQPAVVPTLKVKDFAFTATIDAI